MKKSTSLLISTLVGLVSQTLLAHEAEDPDTKVRKKVIEGLLLAESGKFMVKEAFRSGGRDAITAAAIQWNEEFNNQGTTGYVAAIDIAHGYERAPAIYIMYDTTVIPQLVASNVIVLTPSIQFGATTVDSSVLDDGMVEYIEWQTQREWTGEINWACEGWSSIKATTLGLPMAGGGSVIPRYTPQECE